jgi:hypothetical protein
MNPIHTQLERLLRAAARAPKPGTGAARFTLEARVMGGWRALAPNGNGNAEALLAWLRRMAIGACLLALVSLAWNRHELAGGRGDELAAADSAMRMGVEP